MFFNATDVNRYIEMQDKPLQCHPCIHVCRHSFSKHILLANNNLKNVAKSVYAFQMSWIYFSPFQRMQLFACNSTDEAATARQSNSCQCR